jgi:hypothetical protein
MVDLQEGADPGWRPGRYSPRALLIAWRSPWFHRSAQGRGPGGSVLLYRISSLLKGGRGGAERQLHLWPLLIWNDNGPLLPFAAGMLVPGCSCLAVADYRFPTNQHLRQCKRMAAARLSPDGQLAIFEVTDSTVDGGKSHIWVTGTHGEPPRQLTYSPVTPSGGRTALPDYKRYGMSAFTRRRY